MSKGDTVVKKWKRISKNTINTPGFLVEQTESYLRDLYESLDLNNPSYESLFSFTEEHYKKFLTTKSVAGIIDVTASRIVFDLDNKNLKLAQKDAIELVERLKANGLSDEQIIVFFSGNKGFEISFNLLDETVTPNEMKNIAADLAGDLESFDTSIYNATRQFRLGLTRNEKSGLYKTPFSVSELENLTIDEIKKISETPMSYSDIENAWRPVMLPDRCKQAKNKTVEVKVNEKKIVSLDISTLDRESLPKGWDLVRWALLNGYFGEGDRSNAFLCLAAYLAKLFPIDITYRMLKGTAELQAQRTGGERFPDNELYNNIIMQVYGPNWRGGTYSLTDPNSWLYCYGKEMGLLEEATATVSKDILTTEQVGDLFKSFATNIDKNRIKIGIKELDEALDMLVGRVYVIAGSPGSGKTSLLFQIFEGLSAQGNKAIFFSYDMSLQDCFQKVIQKEFKITAKDVYEQYKDPKRAAEFHRVFNEKYGNVIFINSSGMTVESMRDRITQAEKTYGEIKVVAVDYMTLTQSEKGDSNEHSKSVIQGLKAISTDMRKCVISLNQPNKANQKINEPLSGYGGIQGSSAVQELANAMLWVYRPGATASSFERDKYYSIECMKNRHGSMFAIDLGWSGVTGTVYSLTPAQQAELARLRQEIKEEKAGNNDSAF